tara:strand:+ start:69 stop:1316 length:1248 start_codon:yes stop_codon:yes gene_type:complete
LSLKNISLDINFVRSKFPAFEDPLSRDWSFFENAGGSYVPKTVINQLNKFMTSTKVQPYAEYEMSKIAGDEMDRAINLFSKMINAKNNEILIGSSTTMNMYVLSNALKKFIKPGDEVIVTNQDHEANIGAWRRLKESGAIIKEWQMNKNSAELQIEDFKKILSNKTKIVAVTHCSNIVGTFNNLKLISELAHEKGAFVIGDGVSYAPHGFPNVKELGVDFYAFSLYKTYGPHLALLYGKEEILKNLPNQNHEFLDGEYPYTLNPGGPNHEELTSLIGIYEYFNDLYKHHFNDDEESILKKIKKINILISQHEEEVGNIFLNHINSKKNIKLIGQKQISNKNRAPTFSFTVDDKTSKDISKILVSNKIATRNDNFYAWRCLKYLGIDTNDGVIRISMAHYNSKDDINNLINAINKI